MSIERFREIREIMGALYRNFKAWDSMLASVNARVDELRKTLYTMPLPLRGGAREKLAFLEQWHRAIPEDKLKVQGR